MKLTDLRTLGCEQADVLFSLKMHNGRLPINIGQTGLEDGEEAGNQCQQQQQLQEAAGSDSTLAGTIPANHRVPNVRIKVEPLGSGGSSNGHGPLNGQYQRNGNGPDDQAPGNGFECHSTLYAPTHDDVNNNSSHRYLHLHTDEGLHQQQAVSSSTFPDTISKWN